MKILLLGANGQVGWELQRSLAPLGQVKVRDRHTANLEDVNGLRKLVRDYSPDVIVNAADFTVRINCEPDANQSRDELRAAYWIWIHDLMKADPLELKEPIDKQVDRF